MAGRGTLKRTKRRDGGVSDASEEKKVSSATKSEAYNAVLTHRERGAVARKSRMGSRIARVEKFSRISFHAGVQHVQ
jgi:hypothetical protein